MLCIFLTAVTSLSGLCLASEEARLRQAIACDADMQVPARNANDGVRNGRFWRLLFNGSAAKQRDRKRHGARRIRRDGARSGACKMPFNVFDRLRRSQ